jgi:hypothetical protein
MNKGCFKKGNIAWNKGLKGIRLNPRTEFKKGANVLDKHPSWKGGVQNIKNDCTYIMIEPNVRLRRPRKLYEDAFGKIPIGWVIYHLDKDNKNDNLDNLIAIPRQLLVAINKGRVIPSYYEINKYIDNLNNKSDESI